MLRLDIFYRSIEYLSSRFWRGPHGDGTEHPSLLRHRRPGRFPMSSPTRRRGAPPSIDPVLDLRLQVGPHRYEVGRSHPRLPAKSRRCRCEWILETHAHADHLSGARYLHGAAGGKIAIGENIREVQAIFKKIYNLERSFLPDGSQFDHLFSDGETFRIGDLEATALLVPGHTPADMAYLVDDAVFVGDTLFMPDVGTARADFPGGDAQHAVPVRCAACWTCRRRRACSSATTTRRPAASRAGRRPSRSSARRTSTCATASTEEDFVAMRRARDATLEVPTLHPAVDPGERARRRAAARPTRTAWPTCAFRSMPCPSIRADRHIGGTPGENQRP